MCSVKVTYRVDNFKVQHWEWVTQESIVYRLEASNTDVGISTVFILFLIKHNVLILNSAATLICYKAVIKVKQRINKGGKNYYR